jgi:integrase
MNQLRLVSPASEKNTWTSRALKAIAEDKDGSWLLEDVIHIPRDHDLFAWGCDVSGCARPQHTTAQRLCSAHAMAYGALGDARPTLLDYKASAEPLRLARRPVDARCSICVDRPSESIAKDLCRRHLRQWHYARAAGRSYEQWADVATPLPTFGSCKVVVCDLLAANELGLCGTHRERLRLHERQIAKRSDGRTPEVGPLLQEWFVSETPVMRPGVLNLRGLPKNVATEIRWIMIRQRDLSNPSRWPISSIQHLANLARAQGVQSLVECGDEYGFEPKLPDHNDSFVRMILASACIWLRAERFSPEDAREAGFFETEHYGYRFTEAGSTFDLRVVKLDWLRLLLWDYFRHRLRQGPVPRSRGVFDATRRAAVEVDAYLREELSGGAAASDLTEDVLRAFFADQTRRARDGSQSRGIRRSDGKDSIVSPVTRAIVLNHTKVLIDFAIAAGHGREYEMSARVSAGFAAVGPRIDLPRRPFSDDVAAALTDPINLGLLKDLDPNDRGIRDIWEIILATGRRTGEIRNLSLDCIGLIDGLPVLWHDQTKVSQLDQCVRIPQPIYELIRTRQQKTIDFFSERRGRVPTSDERSRMRLFPTHIRFSDGDRSISQGRFSSAFKQWVDGLELGKVVPHQARHTMATNLMRAGANLTQVRRFLGHVSDRMAERYIRIAHSDLESALQSVWVAGPGSSSPGQVLSRGGTPEEIAKVRALAIDMSRSTTRTLGGLCTFRPVVDGGRCPRQLDCESCDDFVLSGADLTYWRRKRQQWLRMIERAVDENTRSFLQRELRPLERALKGLELALDAVGLLESATEVDLRAPQDFFSPVWSLNFSVGELQRLEEG